jgi:hypothetical protein
MSEEAPLYQPGTWVSGEVTYEGLGIATFEDPVAEVRGRAKVVVGPSGNLEPVELEVKQILVPDGPTLRHGPMEVFYQRGSIGAGPPPNRCTSLEVRSDAGVFQASTPLQYVAPFTWPSGEVKRLRFRPVGGTFVTGDEPAHYWVLYLTNLQAEYGVWAPRHLEGHPLRIRRPAEPPPDLPAEALSVFRYQAEAACPVLTFEYCGIPGFVEATLDSDQVLFRLRQDTRTWGVTAVAVGHLSTPTSDLRTCQDQVPYPLPLLLGLGSGRTVGYRWTEFRSRDGNLVARVHPGRPGAPGLGNRIQIFQTPGDDFSRFLSRALASVAAERWFQRIVTPMLRSAENTVYDERLLHLFLAFEAACKHFGTDRQRLRDLLTPEANAAAQQVLQDAATSLRTIGLTSDVDQTLLNRVADRVTNAANTDQHFGIAVAELLKQVGLEDDLALAESAYGERSVEGQWPDTFQDALSKWRGRLLHGGQSGMDPDMSDRDFLLNVHMHLYDCLLRILFKQVGFEGCYDPPVLPSPSHMPVDWLAENPRLKTWVYAH